MKKNKGFTLIEILAVVTIIGLIFILVIPKITTSLKNKKSDVDTTTTNLVLSATKLYVSDHSSKFEKTDGNVSCMPLHQLVKKGYLDGPVKNVTDDLDITNGKSVRITYNKGFKYELVDNGECKVKYIQLATKYLLKKTNPITINNYTDGDIHEMYTFEHEATVQTPALTDYRYIGSDPNNYVEFNNELWRIIGIFSVEDENGKWEERLKIVRDKSIGDMCRDENDNREWKNTSLHNYLNNDYYSTISHDYKSMIGSTKYYLGGSTTNTNLSADIYYEFERGDQVNGENSISWTGKIGLIYPSDYVYNFAFGIDDVCYSDGTSCKTDLGGNPSNSWLYLVKKSANSNLETISTDKAQIRTFYIYVNGTIGYGFNLKRTFAINPSLYLNPDVKITSGDGSINNAYKLSM